MAVFNRILCPVDLSAHSRHALDEAVALGRHYAAPVTAIYIIPPVIPPIPSLDSPAYAAYVYTPEELDAIDQEVRRFVNAEQAEHPIETQVVQGYVVGEILATAVALKTDLIVLGTHGRSGFQRLLLGSVAERVLTRATCAVLAVPPRASDAVPFGRSMFTKVLCAIDYTPSSLKALNLATAVCQQAQAALTVAHVVDLTGIAEPALADSPGTRDHESILMAGARARLHAVAAGLTATEQVVACGKPYRAILDLAREQHSDLIVLGAHGGLAAALGIGSTTNHVVREAPCPVLSIRA